MIWLCKTISFVQYHEKSINEMYIASPLCVCLSVSVSLCLCLCLSGRAWPARGDLQSGTPACPHRSLALDPCLIYDTDRYGWILVVHSAHARPSGSTAADRSRLSSRLFPRLYAPLTQLNIDGIVGQKWAGIDQPDGCQHRADTSPTLTHYAMFIRNI